MFRELSLATSKCWKVRRLKGLNVQGAEPYNI